MKLLLKTYGSPHTSIFSILQTYLYNIISSQQHQNISKGNHPTKFNISLQLEWIKEANNVDRERSATVLVALRSATATKHI